MGVDIDGKHDGPAELAPETFLGEVILLVDFFRFSSHTGDDEDIVGDGDGDIFYRDAGDGGEDDEFAVRLVHVDGHGGGSVSWQLAVGSLDFFCRKERHNY